MPAKKHILVLGADGQLGSCLRELSQVNTDFTWHFANKQRLSLTDIEGLSAFFTQQSIHFCINAAAYTKVDQAEKEPEQAFALNADAPGYLAGLCATHDCRLIHISTDYVFDGKAQKPYLETDICKPQNVYGASKRKGEENVMASNPQAIIIRTSWLYSRYGHNFVKTMVRLMQEKESLNIVQDQWGSPTHALDLARALLIMIEMGPALPGGIYHYANQGVTNWFGLASAVRDRIHSTCALHPIDSIQYPTPASRPAYSVLNTGKIQSLLPSLTIPQWQMGVQECLTAMGY